MQACSVSKLTAVEWGSDVHAPATDPSKVREVAALQDRYGICCSSYGTYFRIGKHRPEEVYPYIRAARILGTDILRVWCGVKDSCKYENMEKEALFEDCRELCCIAEKEKITLCTEFHHDTYTDCSESVLALCQALNSPCFKTYWQPNQFKSVSENMRSAEAVAYLTENIHVFNWEGNRKEPLHEAAALWRDYFSCFAHEGYALLEFMPDGRLESLPREAEALQNILKA